MHAMLTNALGYLAAGLVFATFSTKRMVMLRSLAIASNLAFIGYSYLDFLWPILILHSTLLPINVVRCRQAVRGACGARSAEAGTSLPAAPKLARGIGSPHNGVVAALGWMRRWSERARLRSELSSMSPRDFGDIPVPPSLIADELRRLPWQRPSPQWGEIRPEAARRHLDRRGASGRPAVGVRAYGVWE